jgi:hypothetical protein
MKITLHSSNYGIGSNPLVNTAAITSIKLTPAAGNFAEHSTAYLYGISNA